MSSPQGRTGTILGVIQSPDGRPFYIKQNPDARLTDIEFRIYQAARQELGGKYPIPEVVRGQDPTILGVEAVGESLEHILHRPDELGQTQDQFRAFLEQNLRVRGALNTVIAQTLTVDDQQFLLEYNRSKLLMSMKQIAPEVTEICAEDMEANFWAYRVMNAVGKYDGEFKERYTRLMGTKIEALLPKYGSWLQDNCLRNNASPDGKVMIPFDFNSLQYGLRQMDETGMSGLYLFNGPLAVFTSADECIDFISGRAKEQGYEKDVEEYVSGYLLSVVHQNALLAGYRTQDAKRLCGEFVALKEEVNTRVEELDAIEEPVSRFVRGSVLNQRVQQLNEARQTFHQAFDEIGYQQTACVETLRGWNGVVNRIASTRQEFEDATYIDGFITQHTFMQRLPLWMKVMY